MISFIKRAWRGEINQLSLIGKFVAIEFILLALSIIIAILQFYVQNKKFLHEDYLSQIKKNFSFIFPIVIWMIICVIRSVKKADVINKDNFSSAIKIAQTVTGIALLTIIYLANIF